MFMKLENSFRSCGDRSEIDGLSSVGPAPTFRISQAFAICTIDGWPVRTTVAPKTRE
jgi:hypothetical protein